MKIGFITVLVVTLIHQHTLHAQVRADDLNQALDQVLVAVKELRPSGTTGSKEPAGTTNDTITRLTEATVWLKRRVATTDPNEVSDDYLRALRRAAELLKNQPSREVIEDVASELQAKVDHCRAVGIGMGGAVLLKVNTLRTGKPVPNLRVQALLKIFERLEDTPPRNSARVSSPAEMTLAPGRYWLWAVDEATGAKSERVLYAVTGQKELLVDLTIR